MKKTKKIILITILSFIFILGITIGVLAYYEYYGQYASILNIDGTIKLDAFDVLYPELREDLDSNNDNTYGCTPENPYVIDSVLRLKNLIKLNNSGKLQRSKEKNNIEKYYFCLEFDEQELAQVLNLANEGVFQSIGNNDYPFVDELSGIVYSYNGSYYSGCLEKISLTETTTYNGQSYPAGDYVKVPTYDANHKITTYSYVEKDTFNQNYTKVHQIIANETIEADDTQLDIGFISRIGTTGFVHDLILYNISVNCVEETRGSFFDVLKDILIGTNSHSHAIEDAINATHERHIGIFAGHIDGAADNISVAGTTNININTANVNYYSNYTTVGFIDPNAYIGGVKMSALETDSFLNGGSVSGCLFADNIYQAVVTQNKTPNSTNSTSGAKYYKLSEIATDTTAGWQALEGNTFSYGAFTFMLSSRTNDALSTIWQDADKTKKLLGLTDSQYAAYIINQSVLYCSDEYRFADDATSGGSIIRSSASVAQGLYAGVRALDNGGAVVDAGKYLIVAKVVDATRTGGYAYYALKLTIDSNSINSFDDSDAIDITNYVLDTTGNEKVYQSCVWEVESASSKPVFKNNRWDSNYLTVTGTRTGLDLVELQSSATSFEVNMTEDQFYYTYNNGTENIIYYVNFNIGTKTFSLSTESDSVIQLYRISNGFNLTKVTAPAEIMEAGDYVIVAENGTNSYLVGIDYQLDSDLGVYKTSNEYTTPKSYVTANFPTSVTLSQYNEMINYIWYTNDVSSSGVVSFKDKVSMTYFISRDNSTLSLSSAETYWTYAGTTSGTLKNGNYYINYSGSNFGLSTTSYNLSLYRLVPQDETPLYISYDGAKHLDADSTELKAGEYVIVANDNGTRYPLGLSNSTTVNNSISHINIDFYNPTTSYLWTISEDTYTPRLINKGFSTNTTSYNLYTNGSTLNASTTSLNWYYDAIESRLYTFIEGNKKYIDYNTTDKFVISDTIPNAKIEFYKNEIQYSFENIQLLTTTGSFTTTASSNKYYFISYYDITNTNNAPVLMEWNSNDPLDHRAQRSNVDYSAQWNGSSDNYTMVSNPYTTKSTYYYQLTNSQPSDWNSNYANYYSLVVTQNNNATFTANNYYYHDTANNKYIRLSTQPTDWQTCYSDYYTVVATAATYNSSWQSNTYYSRTNSSISSLSTTDENVTKALWGFETTDNNYTTDSGTSSGRYNYLYNKYFEDNYSTLENGKYNNSMSGYTRGKLYLSVDDSMNQRSKSVTTKKIAATIPNYNSGFYTRRSDSGRLAIYFIAAGNEVNYALYIESSNGVLSFKTKNSSDTSNTVPYIYSCTYNTLHTLTLISSNGDILDNNINYVIAAKLNDKYYGLSYDSTNSDAGYTGTDVTTYVNPILTAPNERIQTTVNVPKNSDWTCVANGAESMFYQTAISTNNTRYYLDNSGTSLTQIIINTGTTPNVLKMYYDTINKVMKCIKNSTTYYLTYDEGTNSFGLSTNRNSAAEIHLFRYDASYSVSIVTTYDQCLYDGDFLIAGHSDDGWTAIGTNGSSAITTDVTNMITSSMSEADYKSLLDYIYHQYEYSSESTFNSNINSGYVLFKDFNLSETGSIAYKGNTSTGSYMLVGDAAPYEWKISKFDSGSWKFLKNGRLGGTTYEPSGNVAMKFNSSSVSSSLTINQTYKAISGYITIDGVSSGSPVAVFNYANGELGTQVKLDASTGTIPFTLNNQYVIVVMNSSKVYSLIGINGTTLKTQTIGRTLDTTTIKSYVDGNNTYVLKASAAETNGYGHALQFVGNTSYYLHYSSSTVAVSTGIEYFEYSYNHVYTDQSRLCKVEPATASGNLNVDGNKITAGGTSTYLYDASTGKIATSLVSGENYAIVIFKDHQYYIVSLNNANNVVPITYGSGLPSSFKDNELWKYNGSKFTLKNDATKYLSMGTDGGLDILDTIPTITWSYSYSNEKYQRVYPGDLKLCTRSGSSSGGYTYPPVTTDTFSKTNYYVGGTIVYPTSFELYTLSGSTYTRVTSTSWGNNVYYIKLTDEQASFDKSFQTTADYGICLFYIRKSDALSETADVESSLNYKAEVLSSLSVMDSENYIIVAEANGRYYALTMKTKDQSTTIDITDDFTAALASGSNIEVYDASVWEQLGKDYSLIFSNQGFASKYIKNEEEYEFASSEYSFYDFTENGSVYTRGDLVTNPSPMEDYILIKNSGGHYYTCMMDNYGIWTLKDYEDDLPTTVQKSEIWKYYSTEGGVYSVSPMDAIIYLDDYYLLSGDPTERALDGGPKTVLFDDLPLDMENYTWTIYPYGTNQYVIGCYDSNYSQIYYLYFDVTTYSFKFTTSESDAQSANKKVQVYRLGQKQENPSNYQTFEIDMNSDGFTIESLPLTEVAETEEVKTYSSAPSAGTISSKVDGEYVIMAKVDENYYALSTDENGNIRLADLSLMFSGNFLIDTNGNYCLSINTKYIWKQTGTPSVSGSVIGNLTFQNYVYTSVGTLTYSSYSLNLTGITYDLGNHRFYNGTTYLNYSRANGFTLSNTTGLEIYLYSLGTDGVAVDENSDILQYTYYSFALNTSAVDYSYFKFNKVLIPELPNMKLDGENIIVSSRGWKKNSTSNISEINSSVYFQGGITYSTDIDTFDDQFEQVTYDYTLDDDNQTEKSVSYYAPKGATSMVITEATPEKPVFVNVVVSTELYDNFDEKLLRYLALWRVADLDAENEAITTLSNYDDGATNSIKDYAYSLSQKFYTPNAAIPLPNCSSTATKQSSYVKVQAPGESEAEVYYLKYINYEHLLAHTFTITSPGIYYLGATYGTVTFCYVSIDNMIAAEESEDNSTTIAEDFSIDFVWGEIGNSGVFGTDGAVGDITYVGRKTTNDDSHTWVNSNIHPKFVNGTSSNPTDYLIIQIERTFATVESVGISKVVVDITTDTGIYDNGKGIMYVNSNTVGQRVKRKVEFNITLDAVDSASTPIIINKNVVSFGELSANSIQTAYYKGTAEEWLLVENNTAVTTVRYYSQTEPESNIGNYWHYDDNNEPVIWTSN